MDEFRWWLAPGILTPTQTASVWFVLIAGPPLALQAAAAWLRARKPPPKRARHAATRQAPPARRVRQTTRTDDTEYRAESRPSVIMGEGSGRPRVP